MTKLDWSRAGEPNPNPARIGREDIPPQMSDKDMEAFKRQLRKKYPVTEKKRPRRSLDSVLTAKRRSMLCKIGDWIKVVEETGKSDANSFIQKTAILAMKHAQETGNCNYITQLILALPSKARQDRLALWISRFSPIRFDSRKKGSKASLLKDGDGAKLRRFDFERAQRSRFG